MTWKLTLRHLTQNWRLNLVLFTLMVLGASLLASLPMLALTIAGDSLSQSLQSAPVQARNMIVWGKSKTDKLPEDIERSLGDLLQEMIAVREGDIVGFPVISKSNGDDLNLYPATLVLNLRSFDRLDERVQILEGHLPDTEPVSGTGKESPIYEAVIGEEAARRSGLAVGDEVSPAGGSYHLRIVGIVKPRHPNAEIWWGDTQMQPFSAWQRIDFSPDIEEWNISLLVPPQTMISKIYHNQYWRLILDHEKITAANAPSVRETLTGLQSDASNTGMIIRTDLIDLITQFEEALSLAQVSLLLLTFQSLFAVFYLLGMFGSFLVEQSRMELSTLSGRGFSRVQITGLFARSSILLALLAGSLAPSVARWSILLWANWQSIPALNFIPVESWWLALSTGLFSWIFLVISVYRSTRRDLISGQGQGMRFDDRVLTQRHPIWDFFILTLGGLAYWQLTQGSTITQEVKNADKVFVTGISDPVLLLGPTLLLLAAGLILVRLLPLSWRLFAWISQQTRGLLWTLGFTRLSRQPVGPSQVTLLISMTAGITFFAAIFTNSIQNWQQEMARYVVGTDFRLSQPLVESVDSTELVGSPGVTATTQVIRVDAAFLVNEYQSLDFDLLAIDPDTFPSVVSFPPGISPYSVEQIVRILQPDSPGLLPVVISSNAITRHLNIGDQITLEIGAETFPVEVVGIIVNFPLVDGIFAITNLAQWVQQVDLETITLSNLGTREMWMAVEPGQHETVLTMLVEAGFGDSIVGNSKAQLEIFQNNLVFREVNTAFELNALVLIPLSVAGFLLIQLFSTRRREAEFNVLQAMGLSKSQLRGLLLFEGFFFIALGLLVGSGIGFGLATMMQPFLSQILPAHGGGFVLNQILIDWSEMGGRLVALIGFYGVGLLVLMISAIRNLRSVQF